MLSNFFNGSSNKQQDKRQNNRKNKEKPRDLFVGITDLPYKPFRSSLQTPPAKMA